MTEVTYVVAGNRRQFEHWQHNNRDQHGVYVQSHEILHGAKGMLLYIGSYRDRPDWQELREEIQQRLAVGDLKEGS